MLQTNDIPSLIAREVLWAYRAASEDTIEKDFYVALEPMVSAELARRITGSGRIWVGREIQFRIGSYAIHAKITNIEPLLSTATDSTTQFLAEYRERSKDEGQDTSNFLAEIIRYPNERLGGIFDALVGLDSIKKDMKRKLRLLLEPEYIDDWIERTYADNSPLVLAQALRDRYPLFILEGEVGSGKTALARSIGHTLAKILQSELALFIVNAQVRGGGHVGELTQNISRAFAEAERCQEREQIPVILLIDEADALAQTRGGRQTHHEDDAGVNTLIQRIDRLRGKPMAVIFATNLVQSLDAAIMRRAVASYHFDRPTGVQRTETFRRLLASTGLSAQDIEQMARLTKPRTLPGYGATPHRYTYSDLSQRIIPRAVEEAVYANVPLNLDILSNACEAILPTPEIRGAP
jgi:SpoVK/Ycf46/Vps4 family AAA+-type ATPase